MRIFILSIYFLLFLTACPNQEEVKQMQDGISDKKTVALNLIETQDYSLDGLLKMQEYFFDFSEKVHMIMFEPVAQKNLELMIRQKGAAGEFCKSFIIPLRYWESLEGYCSSKSFYKCSPEIREYKNTFEKLKIIIKSISDKDLNTVSTCN